MENLKFQSLNSKVGFIVFNFLFWFIHWLVYLTIGYSRGFNVWNERRELSTNNKIKIVMNYLIIG